MIRDPASADARAAGATPTVWHAGAPVPLDHGGPVDRPFVPVPCAPGESDGVAWLERSARAWPGKLAIADDRLALTYAELIDRVRGLARRIAAAVPPDGAVAAVIHDGPALAVAMLAAAGAGRTVVPIDAGHPIERQAAIFAASGAAAVVIAQDEDVDLGFVPAGSVRIAFDPAQATGAATALDGGFAGDPRGDERPAMVVFTSGSSGSPKGLAHPLRAASIARFVARFHVNADDVFVSLASLSQTGVADLMCLAAGATLHIVDVRRRGMGAALAIIAEQRVTFLSFVPSALRMLVAVPGIERAVAALRVLDLHGERILASDIALLRAKLPPDCRISISYGSTEAGVVFGWFVRDEAIAGEVAPIGYLLPDKQVALLPAAGGDPADGGGSGSFSGSADRGEDADVCGELLVRGRMALGSWIDGRLSGERFGADPDDPAARIYAMGDVVRLRSDGLAEFVRRRDRRVKLRGLWADLDEIEAALRGCPGVLDAAALLGSAPGEADEIVAFVVPEQAGAQPDPIALRAQVTAATAAHMAPGRIVTIPGIARLPNHKPDLARLQRLAGVDLSDHG